MKTQILIFLISILSVSGVAQIGINTAIPNAMLDISSGTNGVLLPRIALTANNVAAPVVNPQGGVLTVSTMIYNTATVVGVNGVAPGYYYWNGTLWLPVGGTISNDWKILGNTATLEPANPLIYGTSTIGATENFVGTTDGNDVVIATNTIERLRVKQATGNIGIGTANPINKLHIETNLPAVSSTFSENTFIGNSNGIGIEGKSTNNPAFGIGGKFTGNAFGIQAINTGSIGATTYGGDFISTGPTSTGNRYGINAEADGGSINIGGALTGYGANSTENFGGFFSSLNGPKNIGSQSQGTGPANSLNGGVFGTAGGGNNSTNYGGNFNAQTTTAIGTTNYGGFFAASGGNKNYGIVVPSGGGTVGFGTITPNAMLDISSGTNGVLLPRIALTANNVASPVVNPQGGALTVSTMIYNTATVVGVNGVAPGYYYWNGTLWIPVGGTISNDWKILGNTATLEPANPLIYGTSTIGVAENFVGTTDNNDLILGTSLIERLRIKKGSGNIGIGTSNPTNKLHVSTSNAGLTSLFTENTFVGNTSGIGIIGSAVNNPGFGIGGQFFGGSVGIQSTANATIFTGTATGISGISTGSGGATATRIGGLFASSGVNVTNYGGRFTATGATTNYGADFLTSGIATRNYGGNFSASGGTTGNWAGLFNATGGVTATGADFIANNGTTETTGGYFQANGTSINYGVRADVYGIGATTNYAGNFYSNGGTNNYAGYFSATNGTNNYAGYFSATGATNNYAIVVPNNSGNVGIGTLIPSVKLDIFSPNNTNGLRLLSGNNAQLSYLSIGKATEYAQIGACTTGTFFLDASSGDMAIKNFNSGKILLGASFSANAAMAIIQDGSVGIGTVAPVDQLEVARGYVRSTGYRCRTGTSGTYPGNVFNINWTGFAGQLWIDTFNVGTFQFTSDRRLKENILAMNNNALTRVMLLKPVSFNYKNVPDTIFTGSDQIVEGFIADELQEIIPSAVNGKKDGLTKEGKIQPQTINTSPIVSVLTKAIQEQQILIETLIQKYNILELRLKTLENK